MSELTPPRRSPEMAPGELESNAERVGEETPPDLEIKETGPGPAEQTIIDEIETDRTSGKPPRETLHDIAHSNLENGSESGTGDSGADIATPDENVESSATPEENGASQEDASTEGETNDGSTEAENPDQEVENTADREVETKLRSELVAAFPELNEETEKGEAVLVSLVEILKHDKVTVGEIKLLALDGFQFLPDADMPEGWGDPSKPKEKMLGHASIDHDTGKVTIDLYEELFKPEYDSSRTALIGHELGEIIHNRLISRPNENGETVQERVVDLDAYKALVANRQLEWSDPYVRREQGKDHFYDEMISDDIGDYLNSDSSDGMLRERLHRFPSRERIFLEQALDNAISGTATESESQAIEPMREETKTIYAFIESELSDKKNLMKKPEEILQKQELEWDELSDFDQLFVPETQPMPQSNMKTDTRIVDKWIDFFIYAGQRVG